MTAKQTLGLMVAILLLLLLAGGAMIAVVQAHGQRRKYQTRLENALRTVARLSAAAEERMSLTRSVSRTEQIKARAAGLIGVDLQQAETYPIKWWLIPPIALGLSYFVIFLAEHPIGHARLLMLIGWPIVWLVLTKFIFNWFNNRRNAKLLAQFPDALSTIVRSVRVGIPIAEALRTVSNDSLEPTKSEFGILADKVSIGIPLDVALRALALRIKMTEYQFFATALTLQARSGGGITQTLETLADVIRKRVGLKARGYALTAEARTSSMILSLLPFVAAGALFVMQRPYMVLLFTTKSGESVLGAAILLMGMGLGVIQFMISNVLK